MLSHVQTDARPGSRESALRERSHLRGATFSFCRRPCQFEASGAGNDAEYQRRGFPEPDDADDDCPDRADPGAFGKFQKEEAKGNAYEKPDYGHPVLEVMAESQRCGECKLEHARQQEI